jgi:hypothetical protein
MGVAVTARKLNHTQAITMWVQAHGFAVDRHDGAQI